MEAYVLNNSGEHVPHNLLWCSEDPASYDCKDLYMKIARGFSTKLLRFSFFNKGPKMKPKAYDQIKTAIIVLLIQVAALWYAPAALGFPIEFTDASGNHIIIKSRPQRVVSLVPSISEILFKIGAEDAVQGVTYHTVHPSDASIKTIVGSFSAPSVSRIKTLNPEVIFYLDHHKKILEQFVLQDCQLINLKTDSIADSYNDILLLGKAGSKCQRYQYYHYCFISRYTEQNR